MKKAEIILRRSELLMNKIRDLQKYTSKSKYLKLQKDQKAKLFNNLEDIQADCASILYFIKELK